MIHMKLPVSYINQEEKGFKLRNLLSSPEEQNRVQRGADEAGRGEKRWKRKKEGGCPISLEPAGACERSRAR